MEKYFFKNLKASQNFKYSVIDLIPYIKNESRDWSESFYVDHGQCIREVTLTRPYKEQPGHNTWRFRQIWHYFMFNHNRICHNKCGSRVSALPGCSYDWGIKASIAGQSHSDGDSPAHYTQSMICECLKSQIRWLEALSNLNIQLVR